MAGRVHFNRALENEQCDVVDIMLANGYIPDPTCINIVCKNGNLTLLQTLLKYDMDLQAGLFTAVGYGQTHLLDYLYVAGADVNWKYFGGNTLLHRVTNKDTCKWLLDMGTVQVANENGETAFLRAYLREKTEMAKLLLSYGNGADQILQSDIDGNTSLLVACDVQLVYLVKLLLSYPQGVQSILQFNNEGSTPLFKACFNGNVKIVHLLLSYPEGVQSILHYHECTALHLACRRSWEIVQLLLSYPEGVQSIMIRNKGGETPLCVACDKKKVHIVELLLSYPEGVQTISCVNILGNTPLHIACRNKDVDMVRLLLSYPQGVQTISCVDEDGNTPLHVACRLSHQMDIVELLISHQEGKKTITQPNNKGETPMNLATSTRVRTMLQQCISLE